MAPTPGLSQPLDGAFMNPGREAVRIEGELVRRLGCLGIVPGDSAALRRLFESGAAASPGSLQDRLVADLLGLVRVIARLMRQSAAAGNELQLAEASRALLDAILGRRRQP
jgi:hypothetical protein